MKESGKKEPTILSVIWSFFKVSYWDDYVKIFFFI